MTHKRLSPAIYSKYVKRYHIFPDPVAKPTQYLERTLSLLRSRKYDCVMPFEESSIEILMKARTQIEQYTRLPVAKVDAFRKANNKWEVIRLARQVGVPVPDTFLPANEQELYQAAEVLGFPLVIKPTRSSGSRGFLRISSEADLLDNYRATVARYGIPLVQECIPQEGEGVGVGVLADKGEVLVSFSHRRLREFPVTGGPSTLRESTNDAEIKEYAAAILGALDWTGVAMVEFKRDPRDNKPKLMEVNPRFWGSLHLSYVSGVNFPNLLYEWSMGKNVKQPEYKAGVKCRWLLPGDLANFLATPARFSMTPSFFRFKGVYYDDFMRGDPKGNFASVWCALLSIPCAETWKRGVFRK